MKRILALIVSMTVLSFILVSCGSDEVTVEVNDDGYVVVNGVLTDILAEKKNRPKKMKFR